MASKVGHEAAEINNSIYTSQRTIQFSEMIKKGWVMLVVASFLDPIHTAVAAQSQPSDCVRKTHEIGERISSIGAQMINIGSSENGDHTTFKNPRNPWLGQREGVFIIELGNRATVYDPKDAAASESIMSSPVLQMSWAREILQACTRTSEVTFRLTGSDWIIRYYLMPTGTVKRGQCLPPASRVDEYLPWGFDVCT